MREVNMPNETEDNKYNLKVLIISLNRNQKHQILKTDIELKEISTKTVNWYTKN